MADRLNILFVDDESHLLEGLKRLLRPMRREWNMSFCTSGQEALDMLEQTPCHVIVSDMRMPGMSGPALLSEVMKRRPEIIRVILSGDASRKSAASSVGVAHQFLAKPCEPERLKQVIEQAFALREMLDDGALKQAVSRLTSVPSMPTLYEEIVEELQYPDASIQRIGQIISRDTGMTVKVLQLVNSAFFGLPREASNAEQAVSLLGADTIKALVLGLDIFAQFEEAPGVGVSGQAIQDHCSEVAVVAKNIAKSQKAPIDVIDASMMAGFLHDIGRLILIHSMPDEYRRVMTCAREDTLAMCEAEQKILGASHAEVGAYLLGLWGLPDAIVETAAYHHAPSKSRGDSFSALTAVHIADFLLRNQGSAYDHERLDVEYLKRLGLAERPSVWMDVCFHDGTLINAG